MDILDIRQCQAVAGGEGGGSPASGVGSAVAKAAHGIGSKEGLIGAMISPVGAVVGAIIHFRNNH